VERSASFGRAPLFAQLRSEGPYTDELRALDLEMLRLARRRADLAQGRGVFPGVEELRALEAASGLPAKAAVRLLAALAPRQAPDGPPPPRRLRRVVELMRRAEADGLTILLSHALQYENATVLEVEVSAPDQVRFEWSDLELEVVGGGQRTRHWGAHGGGDRTQIRFIAWPPLPDDLSGVAFRLAAAASPPPEPPLLRLSTPVVLGPTGGAAPLAP